MIDPSETDPKDTNRQSAQGPEKQSEALPSTEVIEALTRAIAARARTANRELANQYAGTTHSGLEHLLGLPGIAYSSGDLTKGPNWNLIELSLFQVLLDLVMYPGIDALRALYFSGSEGDELNAWRSIFVDCCEKVASHQERGIVMSHMKTAILLVESNFRTIEQRKNSLSPISGTMTAFRIGGLAYTDPPIDIGFDRFIRALLECFVVRQDRMFGITPVPVHVWSPPAAVATNTPTRKRRIDRDAKPFGRLHLLQQFAIEHLLKIKKRLHGPEIVAAYGKHTKMGISDGTAKSLLKEISSGPKGARLLDSRGKGGYFVVALPPESPPELRAAFDSRDSSWIASDPEAQGPPADRSEVR